MRKLKWYQRLRGPTGKRGPPGPAATCQCAGAIAELSQRIEATATLARSNGNRLSELERLASGSDLVK